MKTFYGRVIEEMNIYDSAEEAAIDHLNMANSHLFEEFDGRDLNEIRSDIEKVLEKIKILRHS